MNRRQFLKFLGLSTLVFGSRDALSFFDPPLTNDQKALIEGLQIIDAHAHPDGYRVDHSHIDISSTVGAITDLGMAASVFSAVGDRVYLSKGRLPGTEYQNAMIQLDFWKDGIVREGKVRLVLKCTDIPEAPAPGGVPGAILAIEGGDPLAGNPDRVNEFYRYGVRLITLIHYNNNQLGDCMKNWPGLNPGPKNNGLTAAGRSVVERMQELGMVVDVAHADSPTLKQVCRMSRRPVVDSHSHPCSLSDMKQCGRLRTWKDMEAVAKTGGVVCTWPLASSRGKSKRESFRDWAAEILEMKRNIGMEHVGLGTDGGGGLPRFVKGYVNVRDLVQLVRAMQDAGFTREEISAYMGGNTYRALKACIG
ncbi:MAG TPA: membrane dipeptidase [Syntrophales bacterium]|nr:membrane dipeptidase [Syntrophales bacterium]